MHFLPKIALFSSLMENIGRSDLQRQTVCSPHWLHKYFDREAQYNKVWN